MDSILLTDLAAWRYLLANKTQIPSKAKDKRIRIGDTKKPATITPSRLRKALAAKATA
jgi:hypothetical protein